jgi:hypothetical protein
MSHSHVKTVREMADEEPTGKESYMRCHLRLSLLFLLLFARTDTTGEAAPPPLVVLFIGNSYTYVNDLPALVVGLADAAGGRRIEVDRHLVGGCTFERHVKETKAIEKIRQKKWDVVVLQENSLQRERRRPPAGLKVSMCCT